ncbi:MAG: hypothetical protein CVT92_08975 [Bacteroidetes bacterium HGW-Bacteroidetes-1]|jgi:hypothetical protein|nr:MAG: hypothetical protein CVT92_08975 [Bacteroidetes bacterium HGW-Bacteroidetes-1]
MTLRYEYKYFVPTMKMETLRKMMAPFVRHDDYSEMMSDKQYTVRSIYFDTSGYACYFDKVEGIKNRKKFRLRGYNTLVNDETKVFFEIKRKFEVPIIKNRAPVLFGNALHMLGDTTMDILPQENIAYPQSEENLEKFFYHYHNYKLRPVILIIYEREAFLGLHDDKIRVTFDKNLRSVAFPSVDELYCEKSARRTLSDNFILEIKFNDHFPSWMKPIIGILALKRQSVSKYVLSIDTHNIVKPKRLSSIYSHSRFNRKIQD